MNWLCFALLAPLMYAASNVIDKYALEQHTLGIMDYMAFASLGSASLAVVLYLFGSAEHIEMQHVWPSLLSGGLMNISYLLFAVCLTKTDSYQLTPYFLLIPIWLLVLDAGFFGGRISTDDWLAVALAVLGGGVLASTNSPGGGLTVSARGPGLWMLVSVALLTCAILLMDKLGNPSATNAFVMFQCLGFAGTTLVYLLKSEWRTEVCKGMRSAGSMKVATFAANDAADLLGNWLFVSAVALTPTAGYVSLALGIQPIYVIGIVYCLSRINPEIINERITRQKLLRAVVGTLLIVAGLAVLAQTR